MAKLQANATFGKTMEQVRNRVNVRLKTHTRRRKRPRIQTFTETHQRRSENETQFRSIEHSSRQYPCGRSKSQRIRGRSLSILEILELAQTSSGGTNRASEPYHHCAAAASATTTTTTGVSHTIAFADDSAARQTSQKAASSVVSLLTWRARTRLETCRKFRRIEHTASLRQSNDPFCQRIFSQTRFLHATQTEETAVSSSQDLLERHRGPLSDRLGGRVRSFVAQRRIEILADVYRRV